MAEQKTDDGEQKTDASSTQKTDTAAKSRAAAAPPAGTGEEPTPGGVHRPGRAPGEFTDSGPVSMPVNPRKK